MKLLAIFASAILIFASLFAISRYRQSSVLISEGDQLLKQDQVSGAINLYNKAHQEFPFRSDIQDSIKGAQLVLQSDEQLGKLSEVDAEIENAELQAAPAVETPPSEQSLAPNELLVPILMYHHIRVNPRPKDALWATLNVSPEQLDSQFKYLSLNNFHVITLYDLFNALNGQANLPPKPIILTFDDGYENFYQNAFPILKKYNFRATQFVITAVVSQNTAYLTWDQIKEMDKSGLVEFGAHTRHHPNLPDLSQNAIVDEVNGSKSDLESHLGKPANFFAYPYGSYSDFIIKTVKDAGFKAAASTIYSSVQSNSKIYLAPRIMVDGRYTLDSFAKRLP